jgi:hypothetical protein
MDRDLGEPHHSEEEEEEKYLFPRLAIHKSPPPAPWNLKS